MTWGNRLKLFLGTIGVIALVAACTLVFNQRQHAATSVAATITADEYPVGSTYAGTVTAVSVKPGDSVRAGQELASVRSATLLHDLRLGLVTASSLGYHVSKDGTIRFTSAVAGRVSDLTARSGAFLQAGGTLMTIDKAGSLTVSARYLLSPTDYGRLARGATVDVLLPDQRTIEGSVRSIAVTTTAGGRAQAQLTVSSASLVDGADNGIVQAGTPITAVVHLRDDGPLGGITDKAAALMRQVGL